jgi:hypothetical protein
MQMAQFSVTMCSCIAILWVSLMSFVAITVRVASQRVFIVVSAYFVIDSVQKLLDTLSYSDYFFYISDPKTGKWNIKYKGVSKSFRNESITKYALTTINTRWIATQRVMATKLIRLTHKIAIQLHLVAESCTIYSSRSRRPVRKLFGTPSYTDIQCSPNCVYAEHCISAMGNPVSNEAGTTLHKKSWWTLDIGYVTYFKSVSGRYRL